MNEEPSTSIKENSKLVGTDQLIQAHIRDVDLESREETASFGGRSHSSLFQLQKVKERAAFPASSTSTIHSTQSSGSTHVLPIDNVDIDRNCWICFGNDEENRGAEWVTPCKCRGSTKWVHQSCLYRWVDEKQQGNEMRAVCCQQCKTEYIIVAPRMGQMAHALEIIDNLINRFSPFLAAGVFIGSLYWTPVTYGAVTFLQVVGHKKGLAFMENRDPLFLLVGLPAIPIILILARMIRWEDGILYVIRNRQNILRRIPIINRFVSHNDDNQTEEPYRPEVTYNPESSRLSDPVSITRLFCGALLLPTISTIIGRILFESVENTIYRTFLGGITFITVKGILKIYLRQQQYTRRTRRCIVDYTEENIRTYGAATRDDGPSTSRSNGNNGTNSHNGGNINGNHDGYNGYNGDDTDSNGDTGSSSSSVGISANNGGVGVAAYVVHQIPFQISTDNSGPRGVPVPPYMHDNLAWTSFSY